MINLQATMTLLDSMQDCELAISELYRVFSINCKSENREFWRLLNSQELIHAELVTKMMDLVAKTPDKYFPGRELKPMAIKLIISSVKTTIEDVKNRKLLDNNMFFIARDLENSLIENKYNEVLKSEIAEYKALVDRIAQETIVHRKMLLAKIGQIKP